MSIEVEDMPDVEFENQENTEPAMKVDTKQYTEIDHLDESQPPSIDQQIYLVSFVSPEGVANCSIRGIKIWGVFPNDEAARKFANDRKDRYFDMFRGEVGKWLPWDPNPMDCPDIVYADGKQNDFMKAQQEKQLKDLNSLVGKKKETINNSNKSHKKRVADAIKTAAETPAATEIKQKNLTIRERLKKKVAEKHQKKMAQRQQKRAEETEEFSERQENLQRERERIANTVQEVNATESQVKQVDSNIEMLRARLAAYKAKKAEQSSN
jgi:hypothetical protein